MTEIMIRDAVVVTLPNTWTILAWDSTRNNSNAPLTNYTLTDYSVWNEFNLTTNYNLISTFNQYDVNANTVVYNLQGTNVDGSILLYNGMQAPVWTYNGIAYNTAGVVGIGGVIQLSFLSTAVDIRQLLVSVGTKTFGNEPSWAYAAMNYWFDASNSHDYIECRVGVTVKKVKVNQFDKTTPHLYVIYKDVLASQIRFYVDNFLAASIPFLSTSDPQWSTSNQNIYLDSWWAFSDYGYVPTAGTVASATNAYTLFVISYGAVSINHASLIELCQYRYNVTTDAHSASTQTTTLTGSNVAIFGSSNFSTVFI